MATAGESEDFEQRQVRQAKRERMLTAGVNPYPVGAGHIDDVPTILAAYRDRLEPNEQTADMVTVAGRLINIRNVGRLSFATLRQGRGAGIQLFISRATIGEDSHTAWRQNVDLGDIVQATGVIGRSTTGELSVFVTTWQLIGKALRPPPNAHDTLNPETRTRQRYLDMMTDVDARRTMLLRAGVMRSVRRFFEDRDYLEVETPMLQTMHGGAAARPFVTHSNALDMDLYLRIAPELFLKRAIIGGAERVFELNRNFRNEGMDASHAPEFTMLEAYQVHADYLVMAEITETLLRAVLTANAEHLRAGDMPGFVAQVAAPWPRIDLYGSLSTALGVAVTPATDISVLHALAARYGLEVAQPTHGKLVEELWERLVKPTLTGPTFVMDFPVDTSPLVADHRQTAGVVEKWDLYINGMEIATGYSELTDPVLQRQRLTQQARLASVGDVEAMPLDEAFLTALEYGMPPTGGIGLGIDRLMMLINGGTIRDNVLFPLAR